MKLLLASKSSARRRMLEAAGVEYEVVDSAFDEDQAKTGLLAAGFEPRDLAEMLAELKAKHAISPGGSIVLGADQTLELDDGAMLSKPASRDDARRQLETMSGRTHYLHSAAVIVVGGERQWGCIETVAMTMRTLTGEFIEDYLDREYEAVRFNVGGYRIEGLGAQLFESIEGSHFAILGLPLLPLLAELSERRLLAR